jgi:amino acid transporter
MFPYDGSRNRPILIYQGLERKDMDERKDKFGFWSIVLLGVNAIIGSGIFLLPSKVMSLMGPASIGVFLIDMLFVISLSLCFTEAAGMFQKNGGAYLYARAAFGEFVGFEVGIMKWAIGIIAWATMSVAFTTALGALWPPAQEEMIKNGIVFFILVGLALLNIWGVDVSKYLNNVITSAKLVPLLLFVVFGLFFIKGENFLPVFPQGEYTTGSFGAAVLLIFYAFTGFESLAIAAEDMKNPQKNLPRAIMSAILICCIFYILLQVVVVGTLGENVAKTETPIADAARLFMGSTAAFIVTAGMLISIGGINVAAAFITPRSAVALADGGVLPAFIRKKGRFGTPTWAILFTVALTLPLALTGTFASLAAISVVSRFAQYLPTCLAVLVLRKKRPEMKRTFQVPFGPVIPVLAMIVSIWLLCQASLTQIMWGFGGLVVAVPLYFIMKRVNRRKSVERL